jgi:hypothetical protein
LTAENQNSSYHWSTGSVSPAIIVNTGGNYSVTVTNQCGSSIDNIHITADIPLTINLGNDTTVCPGYILDPGYPGASYYWSTGATTQSIAVYEADGYSVEVTNACGTYSGMINIDILQVMVNLGPDTTICEGSHIILDAGNPGSFYYWSTNSFTQTIEVYMAGEYSVAVSNLCGTFWDTIEVSVFDPVLNLGNDTVLCSGTEIILDAGHPGSSYQWSTGGNTQEITVSGGGDYYVNIQHPCGNLTDTIHISELPSPQVNFGSDTIEITNDETVTLDAGGGYLTYHWSTGATTQSIEAGQQGYYYVTVTGNNGCTGTGKVFIKVITGIPGLETQNTLILYPLPAKDKLYIFANNNIIDEVEVFNCIGKNIHLAYPYAEQVLIYTSEYAAGIYFIKIYLRGGEMFIRPVQIVK